jgi:ComF family protein
VADNPLHRIVSFDASEIAASSPLRVMPVLIVPRQIVYSLYKSVWEGLDWIYPPYCGGCGKTGSRWCDECQTCIDKLPDSVCLCCGDILTYGGLCTRCRLNPPSFTAMRSWAIFGGSIRNALHRLKYKGDIALGEILSRPLIKLLAVLHWDVEVLVPVPIGIARKVQRGYNQAAIIGLPIALSSNLAYRPKALVKTIETRSQVGLTIMERYANVHGAFQADKKVVSDRSVLIVDDVTTSGATIEACSSALLQAGAKAVYGITLARSVPHSDRNPDGWNIIN